MTPVAPKAVSKRLRAYCMAQVAAVIYDISHDIHNRGGAGMITIPPPLQANGHVFPSLDPWKIEEREEEDTRTFHLILGCIRSVGDAAGTE